MRAKIVRHSLLALVVSAIAVSAVANEQELPDVTEDGLHRIPDSKMAIVYADPQADLSVYQKVQLLDAYVAFKKNWERDQNRGSARTLSVTSQDIEQIKKSLADEFKSVFTGVLQEGGYQVVGEAGDNVLLVRPAIVNLDVTAPDTARAGRTKTYVDSAGEMTLFIELYDSVTGDLIAKAIDRQADRNSGYYTWSNRVTNKAAADRILKGWAEILLNVLKEAKDESVEE